VRLLALAVLMGLPLGLTAQELRSTSCPVADSMLGPADKRESFRSKYDDIQGTTTYFLVGALSTPLFGNSIEVTYAASHNGQTLSRPVSFSLIASHDIVAGGQDNAFRRTDLTEQSRLREMEIVPVLIDDSLRFSLQADSGSRKYNSQALQILIGRTMKETSVYPITEQQARQFASGSRIQLRVAGRQFSLDRNKMRKLREFYRTVVCTAVEAP